MSLDEYRVRGFGLWFIRAKNRPIFSKRGASGSWWGLVGTVIGRGTALPERSAGAGWLLMSSLMSMLRCDFFFLLFSSLQNFEVEADDLVAISELGRGAYGVVEKVRHAQSGTIMAVKVRTAAC